MSVPGKYRPAMESVPLFSGLEGQHLDRIWDLGSFNTLEAGTTLMSEGEQGMEAYLILEGTVEIRRPDGVTVQAGPIELVGEMSLLEDRTNRRNATAVTLGPVKALVINRHYFQRLMIDEPLLHSHIQERIAEYAARPQAAVPTS